MLPKVEIGQSRAEQKGRQCDCDLLLVTLSREAADADVTLSCLNHPKKNQGSLYIKTPPVQASRLQSGYSQIFGLCIDLVARTNCSFFHKCRCWSFLHFKHSHVRTTLLCTEYKRREKIHPFTVMRPVAERNISLAETWEKCHACRTLLEITVSEYASLSRQQRNTGASIWMY